MLDVGWLQTVKICRDKVNVDHNSGAGHWTGLQGTAMMAIGEALPCCICYSKDDKMYSPNSLSIVCCFLLWW